MTAEHGEGRGERQKAEPAREVPKSGEPRLQGEVRVRVAKRGGALGRRQKLLEGRDSSRVLWPWLCLRWWRALWFRRGALWERGISTPGPHTPSHTFGGPAVRCEQAANGGREGGRALDR